MGAPSQPAVRHAKCDGTLLAVLARCIITQLHTARIAHASSGCSCRSDAIQGTPSLMTLSIHLMSVSLDLLQSGLCKAPSTGQAHSAKLHRHRCWYLYVAGHELQQQAQDADGRDGGGIPRQGCSHAGNLGRHSCL